MTPREEALMPRRFTHWRVSDRTDGANTCVEAATDGEFVAVQNSTLRHPAGPMLAVSVLDWEAFLREVALGCADYDEITAGGTFGPFLLHRDEGSDIVVRSAAARTVDPVRFTRAEWDAFVHGVRIDSEFSVDWLRAAREVDGTAKSRGARSAAR